MPNDPKEDEIPLVTWYDLLEKELKSAPDDLAKIRERRRNASTRKNLDAANIPGGAQGLSP
jgi:hypothetical protein